MITFLALVAGLSYLLAGFAFVLAFGASDIQFILSGVFAICGTVAAAGGGIIERIDQLKKQLRP